MHATTTTTSCYLSLKAIHIYICMLLLHRDILHSSLCTHIYICKLLLHHIIFLSRLYIYTLLLRYVIRMDRMYATITTTTSCYFSFKAIPIYIYVCMLLLHRVIFPLILYTYIYASYYYIIFF